MLCQPGGAPRLARSGCGSGAGDRGRARCGRWTHCGRAAGEAPCTAAPSALLLRWTACRLYESCLWVPSWPQTCQAVCPGSATLVALLWLRRKSWTGCWMTPWERATRGARRRAAAGARCSAARAARPHPAQWPCAWTSTAWRTCGAGAWSRGTRHVSCVLWRAHRAEAAQRADLSAAAVGSHTAAHVCGACLQKCASHWCW